MKCTTLVAIAALLTLLPAVSYAETHIPAGPISGTWTQTGSPYYIEGNIYITSTSSLTIQPGVEVYFLPSCRFRIEGQLLAVGTAADSILFTASDTTQGSESLDFLNTNLSPMDSSRLDYCVISYGVASPSPDAYMHGGGIYLKNSSRVRISHNLISSCQTRDVTGSNGWQGSPGGPGENISSGHGGAIYCYNSSPLITFNKIEFNYTGNASGGNGGNGTSGNMTEGGNGGQGGSGTSGSGGALYLENSPAVVLSNKFSYNFTGNGSGGHGGTGGNAMQYDVYVYGGDGGSGGLGKGGSGGAIYIKLSNCNLLANTYDNNHTGAGMGGAGGSGGIGWSMGWIGIGGPGGIGNDGIGGDGGAIFTDNSSPQKINQLFYLNHTGDGVGGVGGDGGAGNGSYGTTYAAGGHGGSGYGGNGFATCTGSNNPDQTNNSSFTAHLVMSQGIAGAGGSSGNGQFAPSGSGSPGNYVLFGSAQTISNTILWNNAPPSINSPSVVTFSCIQGGFPGTGNISVDPLFVNSTQNDFHLSQILAGQTQQSPCVDAGDPTSTMIIGSTRTDGIQDSGIVDMGYHYPLGAAPPLVLDINTSPVNPPVVIPANGGSFPYNINAHNLTTTPQTFQIWNKVRNSVGQYTNVFGPITRALPGGANPTRVLNQTIAGSISSGTLYFISYIGTYPSTVQDSSFFTITKSTVADGNPWIAESYVTGDLFYEFATADEVEVPQVFSLGQNFPNPFNPLTTISFGLPEASQVKLTIFDVMGRQVATLVDGQRDAGIHNVTFDATGLASGIYLYKLEASGSGTTPTTFIQKMVLLK